MRLGHPRRPVTLLPAEHAPYVYLDIEPTGIDIGKDRVYEIGIVTASADGEVLERYETLVQPDGAIPARLRSALADAPSFEEIAGDVVARLRAGTVVGHNTYFDLAMVNAELVRLALGLGELAYLDTIDVLLGLGLDTPGRRLGPVCVTLGVEMSSWHTAAGDADTTRLLLLHLAGIADQRRVFERMMRPGPFAGATAVRPVPAGSGRTLPRDVATLPPLGEQPEEIDPARPGGGRGTVEIAILPPTIEIPEATARGIVQLTKKRLEEVPLPVDAPADVLRLVDELDSSVLATAWSASTRLLDWSRTPAEIDLDQAIDELERDRFPGEKGIERLREIISVLDESGDDDMAAEARLRLAEALRYSPKHGPAEVMAAYASAFGASTRVDGADVDGAFADWLDFVAAQRDLNGLFQLLAIATEHPGLDPSATLVGHVHSLRTGGEVERAIAAAQAVAPALAEAGWLAAAADVCAEHAQALAEAKQPGAAIEACEGAWTAGWASVVLANRHSLLLERAGRYAEAIAICDRGLAIGEKGDQIARRRARCEARLG